MPLPAIDSIRQLRFVGAGAIAAIFLQRSQPEWSLGCRGIILCTKNRAEGILRTSVSLTLIMELGPVLTALMVAGRAGSAMCAELGIMRISEQIDALDCMAIDPYRYLITPKFLAAFI